MITLCFPVIFLLKALYGNLTFQDENQQIAQVKTRKLLAVTKLKPPGLTLNMS
jgi:hypothetical protein